MTMGFTSAGIPVLLLGDSTVIGSVCREMCPKADTLEQIVCKLLASEGDLPPVEVVNRGRDSDSLNSLLSRLHEEDVAGFDFIFIRYGLNDICELKDFETAFVANYCELISRLRAEDARAEIVLETVIPYAGENPVFATRDCCKVINEQLRAVAAVENLPLLDQYGPYAAALKHGPNMLTYRRLGLAAIPEKVHAFIPPEAIRREPPTDGQVVYMFDNLLDVHMAEVPGWFQDRHPNPAGYHVIGAQLADYLAKRLRE